MKKQSEYRVAKFECRAVEKDEGGKKLVVRRKQERFYKAT